MGIIWNLSKGAATFRSLQISCETISPSILNCRLKDLRDAKLVERSPEGYQLTEMGQELSQLLHSFGTWSKSWANLMDAEKEEGRVDSG